MPLLRLNLIALWPAKSRLGNEETT